MEETVEPAEEAPFTLVQGKHQRKRPTPESAPMTQAVKSGPSGEPSQATAPKMPKLPTPDVPQTQTTQPALVKPVTQQKPPAESKIPPVIIRDASKWSSLSQAMVQKKINFSKARSCVDGIRVNPVTVDDFRSMTRLFEARGMALSHLRPLRGKDTPSRAPNGAGGNQRRRRQSRPGESRSGA
jgi:hypothetical protein